MNTKAWYLSKGVWAGILTALIGVYELVIPVLVQFGIVLPNTPPALVALLGSFGLYSRVTANTVIK